MKNEAGDMTIVDIRQPRRLDQHIQLVTDWTRAVWEAWSPYYNVISKWAGPFLHAE
jgi:hypothetical protein